MSSFKALCEDHAPGETWAYYRGNLAVDRLVRPYVNWIANILWAAYELGYVHLKQFDLGDGTFEYLAERTSEAWRGDERTE